MPPRSCQSFPCQINAHVNKHCSTSYLGFTSATLPYPTLRPRLSRLDQDRDDLAQVPVLQVRCRRYAHSACIWHARYVIRPFPISAHDTCIAPPISSRLLSLVFLRTDPVSCAAVCLPVSPTLLDGLIHRLACVDSTVQYLLRERSSPRLTASY